LAIMTRFTAIRAEKWAVTLVFKKNANSSSEKWRKESKIGLIT
jgi:hypothetical protein